MSQTKKGENPYVAVRSSFESDREPTEGEVIKTLAFQKDGANWKLFNQGVGKWRILLTIFEHPENVKAIRAFVGNGERKIAKKHAAENKVAETNGGGRMSHADLEAAVRTLLARQS